MTLIMRSLPDGDIVGEVSLTADGKCVASTPALQDMLDSTGQGMTGQELYFVLKEGWMNGYVYATVKPQPMLVARSTELTHTLAELAALRPVFHSEADFQLALAWQVKTADPHIDAYLETRPAEGVHLDLAFERRDLEAYTAIELKYLTRRWAGDVNGQHYELKDHGAQDIRAYDVVKDICRVEEFVKRRPGSNGAVVVLTNDGAYWRTGNAGDTTNAAQFRIGEGTLIAGPRCWGSATGAGTKVGREETLNVCGQHELHWTEYSNLGDGTAGARFRQLVIEVPATDAE